MPTARPSAKVCRRRPMTGLSAQLDTVCPAMSVQIPGPRVRLYADGPSCTDGGPRDNMRCADGFPVLTASFLPCRGDELCRRPRYIAVGTD
jgi:hypothetical protein